MKTHLTATALVALLASPAVAQSAIGLTGDRTLVTIDLATATVTGSIDANVDGRLLGIDYRAGTQSVIGVTADFRVVDIDVATGDITPVVQMDTPLAIADGAAVIVDINPAADALRFMSGTVNHRVNLTSGAVMVDGALHFAAGAGGAGEPAVGGTAYINNIGRPESTAMYNIDTAMAALLRQAPPNDGTNTPVGMLGVTLEGPVAFDVGTSADGTNTAWLASGGWLHQIDLASGAVAGSWELGGVEGTLRDMTVLSGM